MFDQFARRHLNVATVCTATAGGLAGPCWCVTLGHDQFHAQRLLDLLASICLLDAFIAGLVVLSNLAVHGFRSLAPPPDTNLAPQAAV